MTLLPVLGREEAVQTECRVSDTKQSIPFSIQKHLKEKYRKNTKCFHIASSEKVALNIRHCFHKIPLRPMSPEKYHPSK